MKMESLQQRREELERKEFHLKESLLKFDKFLKVKYCRGGSRQSPQTHGRRSTFQSLIFLSLLANIYGVPSPKENSSINIKKPFLNFFVQP